MAETLLKFISDLEKESRVCEVDCRDAGQKYSTWLSDAVETGKRRILDVVPQTNKRRLGLTKNDDLGTNNENIHPNNIVEVSANCATTNKVDSAERRKDQATQNQSNMDVWSMKVTRLRKELKARGLPTAGRKLDLQNRLQEAVVQTQDEMNKGGRAMSDTTSEAIIGNETNPKDDWQNRDLIGNKPIRTREASSPRRITDDSQSMEGIEVSKHQLTCIQPIPADCAVVRTKDDEEKNCDNPVSTKTDTNMQTKTGTDVQIGNVAEIEMEDAEESTTAHEELTTNDNLASTSSAASVTNDVAQLSPESDDDKQDSILIVHTSQLKDRSDEKEQEVFEGTSDAYDANQCVQNQSCPAESLSTEACSSKEDSPKKKQALGILLKATATMLSPKRRIEKVKSEYDHQLRTLESSKQREEGETRALPERCQSTSTSNRMEERKDILVPKPKEEGDSLLTNKDTTEQKGFQTQELFDVTTCTPAPEKKTITLSIPSLPTGSSVKKVKTNPSGSVVAKAIKVKKEELSGTSLISSQSSSSKAILRQEMRKKAEIEAAKRAKNEDSQKQRLVKKHEVRAQLKKGSAAKKMQHVQFKIDSKGPKSLSNNKSMYKATEDKKKADDERKEKERARLAEMRGKVRKEQAKTNTRQVPNPSSIKAKGALSACQLPGNNINAATSRPEADVTCTDFLGVKQKEEKKKMLAAQMREKAAAEAHKKATSAPETKQKAAHDQQQQMLASKVGAPPFDSYEMSEKEEESDSSEDESDSEREQSRSKKRVPTWAQRSNLMEALERQFDPNRNRIDPDVLFGKVHTCNLEEIFDQKKSRYQRRTSSAYWTQDKVTAMEELTYKRDMGFTDGP